MLKVTDSTVKRIEIARAEFKGFQAMVDYVEKSNFFLGYEATNGSKFLVVEIHETYYAVNAYGHYSTDQKALPLDGYYIFKTAGDLNEWMTV